MAEKFITVKGEVLRKNNKRKKTKKIILIFILIASVFITLCLKLSYFNISEINVYNNKNVSSEDVIKLSNINKGSNIFYINTQRNITDMLKNPYILNVSIKRRLPSTIDITVKERVASFYCVKGNEFLIIGEDGVVLEQKQNLNNNALIKLFGFNTQQATLGKVLPCDDERKISVIGTITEIVNSTNSKFKMTALDISDLFNIRAYYGNMYVNLGTSEDLYDKLNKAINILGLEQLKNAKGYIDVSVDSKPVFYIEK